MHSLTFFDILGVPARFFPVAGAVVVFAIAAFIAFFLYRTYSREERGIIPSKSPSIAGAIEFIIEGLENFIESILGEHAKDFSYLLIGIFFFILFSNLLGLIPGFIGPTTSLSTNLYMALMVFIYYNYIGIKKHGFSYFKTFLGPIWWLAFLMLPIEILSHLARVLSLTLRLTGNMSGEHTVMGIFASMIPIGLPAAFLFLGLLTCILQAFVFMTLSAIYILLSLEIDH